MTSYRWLPLLALAGVLAGCSGAPDPEETQDDALYTVPQASASRLVLLSNVPALSRVAAERARGEADAVIATWHVHHVITDANYGAILVYGADRDGMVRTAFVLDDESKTLTVVEPDAEATIEPPLAALTAKPQTAFTNDDLAWFSEEFARLSARLDETTTQAESNGGTRVQTFEMSGKCAARLTTMALSLAAGVVMSPVGGFVVAAVESAAWGDFENAAVMGGVGGASAGADALAQSERAALRNTGNVLKTLGKVGGVGVVGLIGVTMFLDPKGTLDSLIPPQCKKK
jgi:hypothetical protein